MTLPRGYRRLGNALFRELTRDDRPSAAYRFVVFPDEAGAFRWRFVAPNGRVVAVSGEAYLSEDDCKAAVIVLCREAKSGTAIEFDRGSR
jgi:uncharacterized protein YegP (UPF0339 family)